MDEPGELFDAGHGGITPEAAPDSVSAGEARAAAGFRSGSGRISSRDVAADKPVDEFRYPRHDHTQLIGRISARTLSGIEARCYPKRYPYASFHKEIGKNQIVSNHYRMTTKHKLSSGRGEGYAEEFAFEYESVVWERYLRAFDMG